MIRGRSISGVLRWGHLLVNLPITLIMLLIWLITGIICHKVSSNNIQVTVCLIGFFLGFAGGWLYWSIAISKWKIWAFSRSQKKDWLELESRAIHEKLIWKRGSIFNKTEIRTKTEGALLEEIEVEMEKIRIGKISFLEYNEGDLPAKTKYYFTKSEVILNVILLMIMVFAGSYLLIHERLLAGVVTMVFGIYIFKIHLLKDLFNREVQLILSHEGIYMKDKNLGFIHWDHTRNFEADSDKRVINMEILCEDIYQPFKYDISHFGMDNREALLGKIHSYQKLSKKR